MVWFYMSVHEAPDGFSQLEPVVLLLRDVQVTVDTAVLILNLQHAVFVPVRLDVTRFARRSLHDFPPCGVQLSRQTGRRRVQTPLPMTRKGLISVQLDFTSELLTPSQEVPV